MFDPGTLTVELNRLAASVAGFCHRLDVDSITTPQVGEVHKALTEMHRNLDGALLLLARRVEDSGAWRTGGDRSCEEFLARTAGTTTGAAKEKLKTSKRAPKLPETEEAIRQGKLSTDQANAVTDGAVANPAAEQRLLDKAKLVALSDLRDEARKAKAAADPDPEATAARIHADRFLRRWTDGEGAYNLALRTTAKAGADIDAALAPVIDQLFHEARKQGREQAAQAYAADALHRLVTTGGDDRKTKVRESKVIALVSHDALVRGRVEDGETCELAGIGPVPVSTVHEMLDDAFLAAVVTDGVDVYNVAHLGRQATAHQRTALEARGYRCEVPGCPARHHLQIDHIDDWAKTLRTKLDRLAWLCPHHHDQKTRKGWRLEGPAGNRQWIPPDSDPDPPEDTSLPI